MTNADLFNWSDQVASFPPWEPHALKHDEWPPNYTGVYAWRREVLHEVEKAPELIGELIEYYRTRPKEYIMHWLDTYDPRREGTKWVPFVFFTRQAEFIDFLQALRNEQESGLTEKCRDAGATWCACAYSVHSFLFIPDDSIGWGSRKEQLVDKIGDPDSIFEKMRLILRRMPAFFLPKGFDWKNHATYMKMINPENGATITGEAGNNIGRGGRKAMYFKDESAHYERPELIEAALGDNTNCQVDISSVNGLGNPFHNRRETGIDWEPGRVIPSGFTRVFVIDWRDHPAKTEEWYETRRAKFEREGLLHVFAQEVERNYSAAVSNTLIPFHWIEAAVDAQHRIRWTDALGTLHVGIPPAMFDCPPIAGLDVADGGNDRNALTLRRWIMLVDSDEWGERDTGVTARRAAATLKPYGSGITFFDNIGVGAGVKGEYNGLVERGVLDPQAFPFIGWNAGAAVQNPEYRLIPDDEESPKNGQMFENMKAQAWWSLRTRFYKTFKNVTEGVIYPLEELICIDGRVRALPSLKKELAQVTYKSSQNLKTMIEKTPEGTKSPNRADSAVMCYFPIEGAEYAKVGNYGRA